MKFIASAFFITAGAFVGSMAAIGILCLMNTEPPREEFNCDRTGLDPDQIIIVCPEERKLK